MATWTAPPTWVAGEIVTAALLNAHVRDNLLSIGQAWTAYTPTLTASSVNPTLGATPTQTGYYLSVGKLVVCRGRLAVGGAGFAAGTGDYRVSLPVAASLTVVNPRLGFASVSDSSATAFAQVTPSLDGASGAYFVLYYPATYPLGALTTVGAAAPMAWGQADSIDWLLVYEAA